MDRNLMNSAQVLAQSPQVAEVLSGRSGKETLTAYLDSTISGSRTSTPLWWPTGMGSSATAPIPPMKGQCTRSISLYPF